MDILKIKMPNISFNGRRLRRAINSDVMGMISSLASLYIRLYSVMNIPKIVKVR